MNKLKEKSVNSQQYVSSKVAQSTNNYVGVIRDGALHITPVQQVFQMKPSFDSISSKDELVEDMSDDDVEDGEKGQPLQQVRMRRKENEKAEMSRIHSYSYLKAQELAESWTKLEVFPCGKINIKI